MPASPAKPCTYPGCGVLVRDGTGRCSAHPRDRQYARTTDITRMTGRRAVERRRRWLARHPLCVRCMEENPPRYHHGDEVDHVIPLDWGGRDDETNFQTLCGAHHQRKSELERAQDMHRTQGSEVAAANFPAWLQPAACHLICVFGAPASGKSSYYRKHRQADDQLIDLDEIIAELSSKPVYHGRETWVNTGIRLRNRRLGALATAHPSTRVWFLTSGSGKATRDWWIEHLKPAELVVLQTPLEECARRIYADTRRVHVRERQITALQKWWSDVRVNGF